MLLGNARAVTALALVGGPLGACALLLLGHLGFMRVAPPASLNAMLLMLLVAPVLEELAFRGALLDLAQSLLRRFGVADAGPVTCANLITSVLFAACHLPYQSVALSISVLLPSLLLGRVRELTASVLPCVLLHAWFNAWFLAVVAF
jgi:membrane protease YdiL (CAAX protease family)